MDRGVNTFELVVFPSDFLGSLFVPSLNEPPLVPIFRRDCNEPHNGPYKKPLDDVIYSDRAFPDPAYTGERRPWWSGFP